MLGGGSLAAGPGSAPPHPQPPPHPSLHPAPQVNPYGERYTLQMVLGGAVDLLRAVFLHYAQLEASFTASWPPALSLAQFMALAKDTETTDTSAGARIRCGAVLGGLVGVAWSRCLGSGWPGWFKG